VVVFFLKQDGKNRGKQYMDNLGKTAAGRKNQGFRRNFGNLLRLAGSASQRLKKLAGKELPSRLRLRISF
jgi:hypothetical protein